MNRNLDCIAAGRKPRFISPAASRGLKPIPILAAGSQGSLPSSGLAVLRTEKRHEFTLCADGRELGPVTLPSYGSEGSLGKSLLTPLTVTGDAVIVATVVGLIAAMAYAQGGGTIPCH